MSHTTKISGLAIKDVSALRTAVAKLKAKGISCDLVENAAPRMYYDKPGLSQYKKDHGRETCEYVLKLHECRYDVGFEKQADGSYAPIFDEYADYVGNVLGASCPMPRTAEARAQHQIGQFMQAYATDAAVNAAVSQGYMVESSSIDASGQVHLVLTGM